MKKTYIILLASLLVLPTLAEEHEKERNITFEKYNLKSADLGEQKENIDMENGVLGIADDRGFTLQSRDGRFIFKPYLFLQTRGQYHYYDDEGLDKAYNQDNVANSGFSMPYAILGFTGTTFGRLDYNLSINAAGSGGNVLQQAWVDYRISPAARFRAGKFKTPFFHAYLTTLGETLFPCLPTSLTAPVIMPYSLNAVTPSIGMGFDLGFQFHGKLKLTPKRQNSWLMGYELGLWNGSPTTGTSPRSSMPVGSPSCLGARCLPRRATATCSRAGTCFSA